MKDGTFDFDAVVDDMQAKDALACDDSSSSDFSTLPRVWDKNQAMNQKERTALRLKDLRERGIIGVQTPEQATAIAERRALAIEKKAEIDKRRSEIVKQKKCVDASGKAFIKIFGA